MVFGSNSSKRRVLPLQVDTASSTDGVALPPSAAQRSLLPPKSPLNGARSRIVGGGGGESMGGFDRMMLLRNMNVSVAISGAEGPSSVPRPRHDGPVPSMNEEVSAAHNLKERKQMEAKRRAEVQLMTKEDYINTPEGDARLRRQEERARMQEEELRMQRVVQHEKAQRRAEQLKRQQEEEARLKEMYLAKRRAEREEQERVAREKEAARKQALEVKMKALKEEADRKAREEYAARQRALAEEARAEQDLRVASMETIMMQVEDVLGGAMRAEWLAEVERLKQIEAEAIEWAKFEEQEAQRQREETQRRREAQKEQYEQDRARRMQIHKLHQERERAATEKKRQVEQTSESASAPSVPSLALQRLRSQTEALAPPAHLPGIIENPVPKLTRQLTSRSTNPTELSLMTARLRQPSSALPTVRESVSPDTPLAVVSSSPVIEEESSSSTGCTRVIEPAGDAAAIGLPGGMIPVDAEPAKPTGEVNGETSVLSAPTNEPVSPTEHAVVHTAKDTKTNASVPDPSAAVIFDPVPVPADSTAPPVLTYSLESLRSEGVTPIAEVLSVNANSPAMAAGLAPHDLLLELDGITSATPKCLVAIAQSIQNHVDQSVSLVVLRPREPGSDHVDRHELSLVPRKWKGKGLLGCQLSPFKWPDPVVSTDGSRSVREQETTVPAFPAEGTAVISASSPPEALVFYQVQVDSLAHRVGLQDGDVLAKCGDLDHQLEDLANVAGHLQLHWREAQQQVTLVVQRWDPTKQDYAVIHVVLPVPKPEEPLGCSLTTYSQYYYPQACAECCYSNLASSLHAAAFNGHIQCLETLIASCPTADLLDWRDDEGRSPLFYACYATQADSVYSLLSHLLPSVFDPVTGVDNYGESPLHAAASSGCQAAVELLLDTQFINDVNLPNSTTQATAAHVAVSEPLLRVLKDKYNADLLALDADGRMPLFYACLRCDVASVAFLCELHPEFVDYADSAGGNTPLHMAAWCGYRDVVSTLLPWLPTIALYVPNQDGLDARALAAHGGWTEIVELLDARMMCVDADD